MDLWKPVLFVVVLLAGTLLFTPYEAFLEGAIALIVVAAVLVGFLMHPRRDVFYVRTTVRLIAPDRNQALEHDFLAVRVGLAKLWLLFVPTSLAVASLVFLAAGGPTSFSFLNWIFSSRFALIAMLICQYPPLLVFFVLAAWVEERRVLRDAEACSATSFKIFHSHIRHLGHVSYAFRGERGEYYGGHCLYFGLIQPLEPATIVFHNVRKPDLNKIAMGFLFHDLIVLGRGVTDLDKQTIAAQTVLAETTSPS